MIEEEEDLSDFLRKCAAINPDNLEEEFTNVIAELSFCNERYAIASSNHAIARENRKNLAAMLYFEKKEELGDKKERVTEALLDAAIRLDHAHQKVQEIEMLAEKEKMLWYGRAETSRAKKDVLVSVASLRRAEMTGDPLLKAQAQKFRME